MEERIKQIMDEVYYLQESMKVLQRKTDQLIAELKDIPTEPDMLPAVEPDPITYFDSFAGYNVTNYVCPVCHSKVSLGAAKCCKCNSPMIWNDL